MGASSGFARVVKRLGLSGLVGLIAAMVLMGAGGASWPSCLHRSSGTRQRTSATS